MSRIAKLVGQEGDALSLRPSGFDVARIHVRFHRDRDRRLDDLADQRLRSGEVRVTASDLADDPPQDDELMNELADVETDPYPRDPVLSRHIRPRRARIPGQLLEISFLQEPDHRRQVVGYPVAKLRELDALRPGDVPSDLLEPASFDLRRPRFDESTETARDVGVHHSNVVPERVIYLPPRRHAAVGRLEQALDSRREILRHEWLAEEAVSADLRRSRFSLFRSRHEKDRDALRGRISFAAPRSRWAHPIAA